MNHCKHVSVVLCAKNEAKTIEAVIADVQTFLPYAEIIVVDNGSTDNTAELAKKWDVIVLSEPKPGKGHAMRAGAAKASRDFVLFHDADGEYSVADCVGVVEAARKQAWGLGARQVGYSDIFISSWAANRLIRALLKVKTGIDVPDILTGTRCIPKKLFYDLNTVSPGFAIETEITRKLLQKGLTPQVAGVRFNPRTVEQGKKIRARDLLSLIREALRAQ